MCEKEKLELTDEELDEVLGGIALPAGVDRPTIRKELGTIVVTSEMNEIRVRDLRAIFDRMGIKISQAELDDFRVRLGDLHFRPSFLGSFVKERNEG